MDDFTKNNGHLGHLIRDCFLEQPDAVLQIDAATGKSETRLSALSRSMALALGLRQLGLAPGDILALGGNNHLDLHIPYYAACFNGYPIAGVDPFFKFEEIKTFMKLVSPKIAFCDNDFYNDYQRAVKELCLETKIVTFGGDKNSMNDLMIECNDVNTFQMAEYDTDKVYAWLVSTSGSTGYPKVAAIKHQPIMTILNLYKTYSAKQLIPALNLSAVQWISGYYHAISFPLMNAIKVQSSAPMTVEHAIDIINQYKPRSTMSTPFLFNQIMKHERKCDLTCFDQIIIGGANVYKAFLLDLRAAVRPDTMILILYGQTECLGAVLSWDPKGPLGSCGKEMPLTKVKLVDPDTGDVITQPNISGELWTKGPRFSEYYKNPEETAKTFSEDGWYKTGDILYKDENGYYFFVERMKTLIKFRSYHIAPMELEEVIAGHSGVLEVVVTSIPSAEDGEWPVAVVVRRPGSDVTAQDIKDLVADKLSLQKQLRGGVVFVEKLPMTSTGKPARVHVRQLVSSSVRE